MRSILTLELPVLETPEGESRLVVNHTVAGLQLSEGRNTIDLSELSEEVRIDLVTKMAVHAEAGRLKLSQSWAYTLEEMAMPMPQRFKT